MRTLYIFIILALFHSCSFIEEIEETYSPLNEKAIAHQSNPDSAIYFAEKSLTVNKDHHNAYYSHFILADAYNVKKDYQNAVKHYLEAIRLVPEGRRYHKNTSYLYWCLGRIFKIHNNYSMSESFYKTAMKFIQPEDKPGLMYNMGNLYMASGEEEKAANIFFESLDLAKDHDQLNRQAKIYNRLGHILVRVGDYAEADEYFFQIINQRTVPEYAKYAGQAYHSVGHSHMMQKNYEKAITYFVKALELKKKDKEKFLTYKDMGACYHALAQYEKAAEYYKIAESMISSVEVDNYSLDLYKLMHLNYRDMKDYDTRENYITLYETEIENFIKKREQLHNMVMAANIALVYNYHVSSTMFLEDINSRNVVMISILIGFALVFTRLTIALYRLLRVRIHMINAIRKK